MKTMGQRIHDKRVEYGMTMEELGAKLGVQRSAVNKWEKGEVLNIKRSYIKAMADMFRVSPAWLMGMEDADATLTYTAPDREPVTVFVDGHPIIGHDAPNLQVELYQAALDVRPENYEIAIKLLKSLA